MAFTGTFRLVVLFSLATQTFGMGLVTPVLPRLMEKFSTGGVYGVSIIHSVRDHRAGMADV